MPLLVLVTVALAIATKYGAPSLFNAGPQGFSENLYAYMSQANNNGSAFAGYTGYVQPNAPGNVGALGVTFADLLGGLAMVFARFVADARRARRRRLAGGQAGRARRPRHDAHRHADVRRAADRRDRARRALTFVPALLLGPVVQGLTATALLMHAQGPHLLAHGGRRPHGGLRPRLPARRDRHQPGRVPGPADGSQVERDGKLVGSRLLGQDFDAARTRAPVPEPPVADELQPGRRPRSQPRAQQQGRARHVRRERARLPRAASGRYDPGLTRARVPVDAVQTSASGVDPHISEANARDPGAPHRARARAAAGARPRARSTTTPTAASLGVLGEPGVNVLELNLALDREAAAMTDRPRAALALVLDRTILRPARRRLAAQARPARAGPQPGDVRRRDRRA